METIRNPQYKIQNGIFLSRPPQSLTMGCCFLSILALITPRIVLIGVWLFSDYLGRAYQTVLWPLLGFLFMPLTTLAYAWAINTNGSVAGGYFVVVLIAALLDLSAYGGGASSRRR